jgi:hypothetical protein
MEIHPGLFFQGYRHDEKGGGKRREMVVLIVVELSLLLALAQNDDVSREVHRLSRLFGELLASTL